MKVHKQTTLEIVERGINAFKDLAIRNNELEEELERIRTSRVVTPEEISLEVRSRPHGELTPVEHEKGIVTGIKQLPDGRYKFRGEDVTIDGIRTVRGGGVFDTLGEAIIHQNKVLESLYVLGLIDEERLLRRRK